MEDKVVSFNWPNIYRSMVRYRLREMLVWLITLSGDRTAESPPFQI